MPDTSSGMIKLCPCRTIPETMAAFTNYYVYGGSKK